MLDDDLTAVALRKQVRARFPDIILTDKDLENWRYRLRRERCAGLDDTQSFLKHLEERKQVNYVTTEFENDDQTPCQCFWIYERQKKYWVRYPLVLTIDATYKTNRYNMPLI